MSDGVQVGFDSIGNGGVDTDEIPEDSEKVPVKSIPEDSENNQTPSMNVDDGAWPEADPQAVIAHRGRHGGSDLITSTPFQIVCGPDGIGTIRDRYDEHLPTEARFGDARCMGLGELSGIDKYSLEWAAEPGVYLPYQPELAEQKSYPEYPKPAEASDRLLMMGSVVALNVAAEVTPPETPIVAVGCGGTMEYLDIRVDRDGPHQQRVDCNSGQALTGDYPEWLEDHIRRVLDYKIRFFNADSDGEGHVLYKPAPDPRLSFGDLPTAELVTDRICSQLLLDPAADVEMG
jgi:hypothetical protein